MRNGVTECWAMEATALPPNRKPEPHEEGDVPAGAILLELWAFSRTLAEAARHWSGDLGRLQVSRGDSDLDKICIQLLALLDVLWRTHCRERDPMRQYAVLGLTGEWSRGSTEREGNKKGGILDMNILKNETRL